MRINSGYRCARNRPLIAIADPSALEFLKKSAWKVCWLDNVFEGVCSWYATTQSDQLYCSEPRESLMPEFRKITLSKVTLRVAI